MIIERIIFSAANLPPRFRQDFSKGGRTKQAFKEETDINWIMRKYDKTGLIDHLAKHGGEYGFASSITLHEAMNVVVKAEQMFADLPASARSRFKGEPGKFLDFVQNPENQAEMLELGLMKPGFVMPPVPAEPAVAPSAPITPEGDAGDTPAESESGAAL